MNKKTFIIFVIIVLVQYYDYHLYGFLAAKIATNFFSPDEQISRLLNTYLIMSIAMIAKPVGALVLGKMGDIYGRIFSIRLSLIGTSIASLSISLVPGYEEIGFFSSVILFLARMVISACISSGSDGVRIFIYENISKKNQCLGIGITSFFSLGGSLCASISAYFFTLDFMPEYSWRFAFLIGSCLGLISLFLIHRNNYVELDSKKKSTTSNYNPQILGKNFGLFITCAALAGAIGSTNQFMVIFWGVYNSEILHNISRSEAQIYVSIFIAIYMIFTIIAGYSADRFDRFKISIFGIIVIMILALLQCYCIVYYQRANIALYLMLAVLLPFVTMPAVAMFKEAIDKSIRYSIFSLSHAVGSIIISAPTAYVSTLLYKQTELMVAPLGYFLITILIILFTIIKLNFKILKQNDNQTFI